MFYSWKVAPIITIHKLMFLIWNKQEANRESIRRKGVRCLNNGFAPGTPARCRKTRRSSSSGPTASKSGSIASATTCMRSRTCARMRTRC
ncbi:hypothetical protein EMIT0111MI5_30098 [Burkholderia sp. IT-111MI5]